MEPFTIPAGPKVETPSAINTAPQGGGELIVTDGPAVEAPAPVAAPEQPLDPQAARIAQLEAELAATQRIAELEAQLRATQDARAEAAMTEPVAQEDIEPFGTVDRHGNWRPG